MPSIKEFVEAMNASWPVALTIVIACAAILASDYVDLDYLRGLPGWSIGMVFVVGIFAGAVVVVRMIQLLIATVRAPFERRQRQAAVQAHIAKLNEINEAEAYVLVWAAQQNRQAFVANFDDARLTPLVAKGFVERVGGAHSILEWPYRIPDHIWTEIRRQLSEDPQPEIAGNIFASRW